MTGEKESIFMDESLLPDYLLPADSPLKKERQNQETNYIISLEAFHLLILIQTINHLLTIKQQADAKTFQESLRHARDIEVFFKNLARIDANSNLQIQLKNIQLNQMKTALEKINQAINKLNETISNITQEINYIEKKISEKRNQLNESFKELNAIFEKCINKIDETNFKKFSVDLSDLNKELTGKLEIDDSIARKILIDAHSDFRAQHQSKEIYNLESNILNRLHKHFEKEISLIDTDANINKDHPVLNRAADHFLDALSNIAECDVSEKFNTYSGIKEELHEQENEMQNKTNDRELAIQKKNALIEAKEFGSTLLKHGKADLTVVKQLTGSLDSLINDLMNEPTPANKPNPIAINAAENKKSEPEATFTSLRLGR